LHATTLRANAAAVCGPLMYSTQSGQRGNGQAANNGLFFAVPCFQRCRPPQRQRSATGARFARKAFRSTSSSKRDKGFGDYLETGREFEIPIHKLLYTEPVPPTWRHQGIPAYRQLIERGRAIAEKL
jgi:hypothetical protein